MCLVPTVSAEFLCTARAPSRPPRPVGVAQWRCSCRMGTASRRRRHRHHNPWRASCPASCWIHRGHGYTQASSAARLTSRRACQTGSSAHGSRYGSSWRATISSKLATRSRPLVRSGAILSKSVWPAQRTTAPGANAPAATAARAAAGCASARAVRCRARSPVAGVPRLSSTSGSAARLCGSGRRPLIRTLGATWRCRRVSSTSRPG